MAATRTGAVGITLALATTMAVALAARRRRPRRAVRPAGGSAVVDTDGSNGQGITNAGTINVASGKLTVRGANYPMILDNEGTASRSAATSWRRPLGTGKAAELTVTRAKGRTR